MRDAHLLLRHYSGAPALICSSGAPALTWRSGARSVRILAFSIIASSIIASSLIAFRVHSFSVIVFSIAVFIITAFSILICKIHEIHSVQIKIDNVDQFTFQIISKTIRFF